MGQTMDNAISGILQSSVRKDPRSQATFKNREVHFITVLLQNTKDKDTSARRTKNSVDS